MPFFSIIIPVFNREHLIAETITSVLAQDFQDFELLLIDDGSSDKSVEVMQQWLEKDSRIHLEVLPENVGRCAARNKGLELASGTWICYLDSDDLYYPIHLSTFYGLVSDNPAYKAFATDQHINGILKRYRRPEFHQDRVVLSLNELIEDNPLTANQLCHKADLGVRWSSKRISISEDWLFLRELALDHAIFKKGIVTNFLRDHEQRSMHTTEVDRFVTFNLMAAEEFLKNPVPRSVKNRVRAYTLILCANVYLSEGNKKKAWPLFKKSLAYARTFSYRLFYKAIVKFFL